MKSDPKSGHTTAWFRDIVLPRSVFIPYICAKIVLTLVVLVRFLLRGNRRRSRPAVLCIESGRKGWELLEYKELYASACEYLGADQVRKVAIDRDQDYVVQVRRALDEHNPTHYMYDPRTGSQGAVAGLFEAFQVGVLLASRGTVPIGLLTDLAVRTWRSQCAVVTASSGLVLNYLSPREVQPIFPHRRLIGPHLFPLSEGTLETLDNLNKLRIEPHPPRAVFAGSLYEPRKALLSEIQSGLAARGFALDLKGRELGTARFSDEDYWSRLVNASIIVTTADQIVANTNDWAWVQHLLYRYLETTACGTLLVAPAIPGVSRFFVPHEHFVPFSTASEAIDAIAYYLSNEADRKRIAAQGKRRADELVRSHAYWIGIDTALGAEALT